MIRTKHIFILVTGIVLLAIVAAPFLLFWDDSDDTDGSESVVFLDGVRTYGVVEGEVEDKESLRQVLISKLGGDKYISKRDEAEEVVVEKIEVLNEDEKDASDRSAADDKSLFEQTRSYYVTMFDIDNPLHSFTDEVHSVYRYSPITNTYEVVIEDVAKLKNYNIIPITSLNSFVVYGWSTDLRYVDFVLYSSDMTPYQTYRVDTLNLNAGFVFPEEIVEPVKDIEVLNEVSIPTSVPTSTSAQTPTSTVQSDSDSATSTPEED